MPSSIKSVFSWKTLRKEPRMRKRNIFKKSNLSSKSPRKTGSYIPIDWSARSPSQSQLRKRFRLFEWITQVEGFTYLRNRTSAPSQGPPLPFRRQRWNQ